MTLKEINSPFTKLFISKGVFSKPDVWFVINWFLFKVIMVELILFVCKSSCILLCFVFKTVALMT